ncbi:MAG: hypothetical protein WAV29_03645 [Microgenomates group bacterium]
MINLTFNPQIKNKIKKYLIKVCKVKDPTEEIILESCQSLYYIGRAHARCELLRKQHGHSISKKNPGKNG